MRHTTQAIHQLLREQSRSDQSVADFCADRDLKIPTFYSWKRKYGSALPAQTGFCEIIPPAEITEYSLCLPSGLCLEVTGFSTVQIAELIVQIDRAHA